MSVVTDIHHGHADPAQTSSSNVKAWEPRFLWIAIICLTVIPLVVKELYPFSLPTMFSVTPRKLALYNVQDAGGKEIDPSRVYLHVQEWHDPYVRTLGRKGFGRRNGNSIIEIGKIASQEEVENAVRTAWEFDPELPSPLFVVQAVFERGSEGKIICVAEQRWQWSRESITPGARHGGQISQ